MKLSRLLTIIIISLSINQIALAQQDTAWFDIDKELEMLHQKIEKKIDPKHNSLHLIGIKYGYNFCNARTTPAVGTKWAGTPYCFSIAYTYYNSMWNMMDNFGLQGELKYYKELFESQYIGSDVFTIAEFSLISQFRFINSQHFRFLLNFGPYAGYRLKNERENGAWDQYDNRFEYGILGGAGIALIFKPLEIHIEGNYKFSLSSMYHVNKISDQYWLYAYPSTIFASIGLFIHLW